MVTMHEDGNTPEGVVDMAGNIYEWTLDIFAPYEQQRSTPESLNESFRRKQCVAVALIRKTMIFRPGRGRACFQMCGRKHVGFRCVIPPVK
jgi:formylglycine-generating enzyme required for sulfatase activity